MIKTIFLFLTDFEPDLASVTPRIFNFNLFLSMYCHSRYNDVQLLSLVHINILIFLKRFYLPNICLLFLKGFRQMDIFLIFLIIILILYLVCLFLLYRFIKFAKNLYIFLVVITFVSGFFVGISVYEPTGLFLTDLFVLSQGAIIYCLLFTDIKNKF